jgi:hypothetical protein
MDDVGNVDQLHAEHGLRFFTPTTGLRPWWTRRTAPRAAQEAA